MSATEIIEVLQQIERGFTLASLIDAVHVEADACEAAGELTRSLELQLAAYDLHRALERLSAAMATHGATAGAVGS